MSEHATGQVAASAAEIYDQFFVPALFADWPPRILDAADVEAGHTVLDVACGTGVLASAAAARVGPDGGVTGVDINEGMLAVAENNAPGVTWQRSPAEALPFVADEFDRVVSQFGLMFFADQAQAIAEMVRVLRPGGVLAVAVWDTLEATPGYAAVAELLEELFDTATAQSIHAPYSLGNRATLRALFAQDALQDLNIRTLPGTARFASIDDWIYTDVKGWTLADQIDDEDYARLRAAAPAKLGRFVQPDGRVAFDAPAHIVTARAVG